MPPHDPADAVIPLLIIAVSGTALALCALVLGWPGL